MQNINNISLQFDTSKLNNNIYNVVIGIGIFMFSIVFFANTSNAELPATPRTLIERSIDFDYMRHVASPKSDGGFILVYSPIGDNSLGSLRVRQYDSRGVQTRPEAVIDPKITFHKKASIFPIDGRLFGIFWTRSEDLVGGIFDSTLNKMISVRFFGKNPDPSTPVTRLSNGNYIVSHIANVGTGIRQREYPAVTILDSRLTKIKGPIALNNFFQPLEKWSISDYTVARLRSGAISIFVDRPRRRILSRTVTPAGGLGTAIRQINSTPLRAIDVFDFLYNEVKSATLTNGNVLVVWTLPTRQSIDSWDIRFRLLSPNGDLLTPEGIANTIRTGRQIYPEIVPLPGGRFSIIWLSEGESETAQWYSRTYNSNGSPVSIPRIIEQGSLASMGDSSAILLRDGSIANIFGGGIYHYGDGAVKGDGFRP